MSEQYPYIRAWGCYLGSNTEYIKREQEKAKQEGAPPTALYRTHEVDGAPIWRTVDDIQDDSTRGIIVTMAEAGKKETR